jgi:hypothetical protein
VMPKNNFDPLPEPDTQVAQLLLGLAITICMVRLFAGSERELLAKPPSQRVC